MSTEVERGHFGLGVGQPEQVVRVSTAHDFMLSIWARNVEITPGGIQLITPPGQSAGVIDGSLRRSRDGRSRADEGGKW